MDSVLRTAQLIMTRKLPPFIYQDEVVGKQGRYRLKDAFEGVSMFAYVPPVALVARRTIVCYMQNQTWRLARHKLFPRFECGQGQTDGTIYDLAQDLRIDWSANATGLCIVNFTFGDAAQVAKICLGVVKALETGVRLRKFRKIMAGAVGKGDWKTLKAKLVARRKRRAMKGLYFF